MCVYSQRLFKEWITRPIIIAVDYDDTINTYGFVGNDRDIARTIKAVKKAKKLGAYITIFTAADPSRYNSIIKKCQTLDIDIDTINKNPIRLPYGNNGKIGYNIHLCDRSGLKESLRILKKVMTKYKLYKAEHA